MSAMNTHHTVEARSSKRGREMLGDALPYLFFVPVAGPPVILLFGPWLLLVLLVIPPAAFLITLVLVFLLATGLLFALGMVIASPYLLVRHLRDQPAPSWLRIPSLRRAADPAPAYGQQIVRQA